MSIDSSLSARLVAGEQQGVLPLDVLRALIDRGWRLLDHGRIRFIPLGDNGNFEWRDAPASALRDVWKELEHKAQAHEDLAVVMTYQGTETGGELVLRRDGTVTFSISIDRRMTAHGTTDVTWYLDRLAPALSTLVEEWRWVEVT